MNETNFLQEVYRTILYPFLPMLVEKPAFVKKVDGALDFLNKKIKSSINESPLVCDITKKQKGLEKTMASACDIIKKTKRMTPMPIPDDSSKSKKRVLKVCNKVIDFNYKFDENVVKPLEEKISQRQKTKSNIFFEGVLFSLCEKPVLTRAFLCLLGPVRLARAERLEFQTKKNAEGELKPVVGSLSQS